MPVLYNQSAPSSKDYTSQSIEVEGSRGSGHTGHYRHPKWSDLKGVLGRLTLPEIFESGLEKGPGRPFLGHRRPLTGDNSQFESHYTWQTYVEIDRRRKAIGSAIESFFRSGRAPSGEDFQAVGFWSVNRPEWQITELGCHLYGKVSVALYDTLGAGSVEYVINHSELPIIFCTTNHIEQLLDLSDRCPCIKMIVSFDRLDASMKDKYSLLGEEKGIDILELSEVERLGEEHPVEPVRPTLDTIATICYTSGTTNNPKGVVLTHLNLGAATLDHLHGFTALPDGFIIFSYLPLAHVFGRACELVTAGMGGCIGYYSGNPLNLLEDIRILGPHFFPAVPRVLNRIYDAVMAQARAPGIKGFLVRQAVETKLANLHSSGTTRHLLWDALVFRKIQAVLGGRLVYIVSGSAPINPITMDFLKIAFGCTVLEGYGLTETCACGTITWEDDAQATGFVGGMAVVCEIKLIDVEELGYRSTDQPNPRGEVCFRGDNVFKKYFKDDTTTSEVIDSEGWFHTGDVAEVDMNGRFRIIDRIKNIMKLSQGEYVALERVENIYSACSVVAQIHVYGESVQDYLIATIVPEPAVFSQIAAAVGHPFDHTSSEALQAAAEDPRLVRAVLESMNEQVKSTGQLKGFEMIKGIHLTLTQFSVDNDTLTPTFKLKRRNAYALHQEAIKQLYAK